MSEDTDQKFIENAHKLEKLLDKGWMIIELTHRTEQQVADALRVSKRTVQRYKWFHGITVPSKTLVNNLRKLQAEGITRSQVLAVVDLLWPSP
jgi:hypothetical protein